jgi:hypothetical protein
MSKEQDGVMGVLKYNAALLSIPAEKGISK